MDVDTSRRDDQTTIGRHVRASSDPGSRGGAFTGDGFGLDSEPNPFESSFSGGPKDQNRLQHATTAATSHHPQAQNIPTNGGLPSASRRARSISPNSLARATPGGNNKLHGMNFGTDLQNYGWGADPQMFDPSMLRTGLTPMVPGGAPGAGGVSFPPPSPATAALFAMMTNNTPGDPSGLAGGGPRPHEGPNEGNQFDASFARAAVKSENNGYTNGGIPPGTIAQQAPTTVVNGIARPVSTTMAPPPPVMPPHSGAPQAPFYGHPPQAHVYGQPSYPAYGPGISQPPPPPSVVNQPPYGTALPPPPAATAAAAPSGGGQNPLYLLSQASGHTDDAVVAAAALSGLAAPGFGSPQTTGNPQLPNMIGGPSSVGPVTAPLNSASPASAATPNSTKGSSAPKRSGAANGAGKRKKSEPIQMDDEPDSPPASAPPAKKGRGGARGRAASSSVKDDGSEDGMSPKAKSQADPDEEKRKNFLERNRQAALKCRQRKKAWLANLQAKVEMLTTDNETLQSTVTNLKEEIQSLRAILAAHANCPVASTAIPRPGPAYSNGQQRY